MYSLVVTLDYNIIIDRLLIKLVIYIHNYRKYYLIYIKITLLLATGLLVITLLLGTPPPIKPNAAPLSAFFNLNLFFPI